MKNMGQMMKQAQKLQAKMLKMQDELASRTVETASGGGMVQVVANGRQEVVSIVIDPKWSTLKTLKCCRILSWRP